VPLCHTPIRHSVHPALAPAARLSVGEHDRDRRLWSDRAVIRFVKTCSMRWCWTGRVEARKVRIHLPPAESRQTIGSLVQRSTERANKSSAPSQGSSAARPPDYRVQCLAQTAGEAFRSPDRLDRVHLVGFGDRLQTRALPCPSPHSLTRGTVAKVSAVN